MKIRFDFVTNSSSSSFVVVSIEDAELARICDEYGINLIVSGDTVSCDYELGESELPIAPKGADFIMWFLNFVSELGIANESAKEEILARKKEIEDSFVSSNIVYEHYCTEDYYYNSHWEETRDKEKVVVKGFDASKWDEIWDTQDWDEIAKLDDRGGDIARLSPSQYPFWLFLSEGWAYPDSRDGFVRNMMDKYATRVIERNPSDDSGGKTAELDTKIDMLVNTLDRMSVRAEDADLSMKKIAATFYHISWNCADVFSYEADRYSDIDKSVLEKAEERYKIGYKDDVKERLVESEKRRLWAIYLRDLYEKAIEEARISRVNSISSSCDYAMVLNPKKGAISKLYIEGEIGKKYNLWDGNKYDFKLLSEQEFDCAMKEKIIEQLEGTISELENANLLRKKKNKPPVKVIWEDQLYEYLLAHTSMGSKEPKEIIGPKGTVRLPVPDNCKQMVDSVISYLQAWPNRELNRNSRSYELRKDEIARCYTALGYPSEEAFLDAYGYSVKAPKPVKKDANAEGDFQYEINKKKEVTIVRYIGQDKCISVPEQIEDGIVKAIGKEAFAENKNIEDVTIPECVDTIKGKAFSYCSNLKTIKLSNNISKIVKDTFEGCSNLTKINIPDNVTTLAPGTFRDCPLESIHIGKSLTSLDRSAFYQAQYEYEANLQGVIMHTTKSSAVREITIDPHNKNYRVMESTIFTADGKVLVAALGGEDSYKVPDGVEIISDNAFMWQGFLKWISFPSSLRIIGNRAFEITDLRSVNFPNSLRLIGARAFRNCRNLQSAKFNEGLEKIYDTAFKETKVKQVKLPDSVNELGFECFSALVLFGRLTPGASIEPIKWLKEISKWEKMRDGRLKYPERPDLDTKKYIEELSQADLEARSKEQLANNVKGFGLLIAMMKYLQTKADNTLSLDERLLLEKIVISQEMETILRTDLNSVLAFYKEKSAKQMGECLKELKTIATQADIDEMFAKIRETFPENANELNKLLKGVADLIGKEV